MTADDILKQYRMIVDEDGPWTSHYLELLHDLETIPGGFSNWERDRGLFALRCAQLALGKRPDEMRVLDLGCLEGGLSIHLARAGCSVVGVEVREASLRKARFAASALGVERVTFVQGDMLRLDELDLGLFDLIVSAGTLYHVDAPDLLPFLRLLNGMCRGVTVFDTHVSLTPTETYHATPELAVSGQSIVEHHPAERDRKAAKLWASAENNHAFWPAERSLVNLLLAAGFIHVSRPLAPIPEWSWQDRAYWVAYSSAHAEAVGAVPHYGSRYFLPDPDPRPRLSPLIQEPVHRAIPNPATSPLQD